MSSCNKEVTQLVIEIYVIEMRLVLQAFWRSDVCIEKPHRHAAPHLHWPWHGHWPWLGPCGPNLDPGALVWAIQVIIYYCDYKSRIETENDSLLIHFCNSLLDYSTI